MIKLKSVSSLNDILKFSLNNTRGDHTPNKCNLKVLFRTEDVIQKSTNKTESKNIQNLV